MQPGDESTPTDPRDRRRWLTGMGLGLAGLTGARLEAAGLLSEEARAGQESGGLRDEYDLDPAVSYLNHASIGTMPRVVREARQRYDRACERNPWHHVWGGAWDAEVSALRERLGGFLGCDPLQLALLHTTTEGFNVLAQGLPLGQGDEVLFSSLNHVGASACWNHRAAQRGFEVRRFEFPIEDVPSLSDADVVELHLRAIGPRTRVLVFPHVDNIVGLRHPVERLVGAARARGVEYVAVDGAQAAGMFPVALDRSGVDFYATSTHKWLQAPKGTGLLYVRREHIPRLDPLTVSWGARGWQDDARRYEDLGTHDHATWLTLGDALDFHGRVSHQERERGLRRRWEHVRSRTEASAKLVWRSPGSFEQGASLVSVGLPRGADSAFARRLFDEHGIVVRGMDPGFPALRVSPNLMNTTEEIDRLFDRLEEWL